MTDPIPPQIDGLTPVKRIGSGGFADVFLYNEVNPERAVAVKVLRDPGLAAKTIRKFAAEANAMARLEHTYIVPVYSTGTTQDGRPYIKMRYYPRPSLAERARRERFSVPEVLQLGIHLGSAIETAHRAGLLHRDIKPANVLTNANGKPGLTDFGIAAQVTDEDDPETGVSVPWSPPETLYGTSPASVRSDVYSLAATLWHLLVGRSPFEVMGGDNSAFVMMKRVRDVPPPSTGRGDVPPSFDRLLRSALSKDPGGRPSSVKEFIGALQSIEQEMRLPRTEAELYDEPSSHTLAAPPPLADSTVLRPAQVIGQPVSGGSAALGRYEDATQIRGNSRQLVDTYSDAVEGRTVLRQAESPVVEPEEAPPERSVKRGGMIVLALVLLLVIGGVGFFLVSGAGRPTSRPTASVSAVAPDVGGLADPTGLTVVGVRSGETATFTWRYDNAEPDDQVEWRVQGDKVIHTSAFDGSAPVKAKGSSDVCIEVRVSRLDGSFSMGDQWKSGCA